MNATLLDTTVCRAGRAKRPAMKARLTMLDRTEEELFAAVANGDDGAFERVYDLFHARVRLAAWRLSHRPDWVDDILSEAWCRAFNQRKEFDAGRPFLVWIAGIVRNVYREECRKSVAGTIGRDGITPKPEADLMSPEKLAGEAELLAGLNECVAGLPPADAQIIRLRFFEGLTLREVARKVGLPESTLRDNRIPAAFKQLRKCLESKGILFSQVFPAQTGEPRQ